VKQSIDLRSDTVTKPSDEMRRKMAQASVGDDVMRSDETVIELEERTASLFGKDAALFTPSGTMANLLAILAQTAPGDEIFTHKESHIFYYEAGGYAAVAGCSVKLLHDPDAPKPGVFSTSTLNSAIRNTDVHYPSPKLLTIENTHNRGGGVVWPIDMLTQTCKAAKQASLRVHTDGARIWNASVASQIDLSRLVEDSDTVSACLSKGLGCPVGSLLMGDQQTIDRARHKRKMLGGGMRQTGILAAAGLYALDYNVGRLETDHQRAKQLALDLAMIKLFDFDPELVETNLVYAKLSDDAINSGGDAFAWESMLGSIGVLCFAESKDTLRFVTHLDLDEVMIQEAVSRIQSVADTH
jgi:threonine aldolase